MNVQDVIEKALAGNDGIPVTPVEHSSCDDTQVEKLAAALNFIGANLEGSVADLEEKAASFAGSLGAAEGRERMIRAGMSPEEVDDVQTFHGGRMRGALKEFGYGLGGGAAGALLGSVGGGAGTLVGGGLGLMAGSAYGSHRARKDEIKRAKDAIRKREYAKAQQSKTASSNSIFHREFGGDYGASQGRERMIRAGMSPEEVDDVQTIRGGALRGLGKGLGYGLGGAAAGALLGSAGGAPGAIMGGGLGLAAGSIYGDHKAYKDEIKRAKDAIRKREYAKAQQSKTASLQKVAEDRINPAQISAGPAAPYSGEIMPRGENVFGGQTMPAQLVAMKAQKVRARINGDMKKFVNNVGSGYNLEGHLNKMNK
jgi:hypothetical protein